MFADVLVPDFSLFDLSQKLGKTLKYHRPRICVPDICVTHLSLNVEQFILMNNNPLIAIIKILQWVVKDTSCLLIKTTKKTI